MGVFVLKLAVLGVAVVAVGALSLYLTVAHGFKASEVTVPNVVGMTVEDAGTALAATGLEIYVEARRPNEAVEAGRIFFQDPLAGARSRRSRHVKVVVSGGANDVATPDLTGQSLREAVLTLGNVHGGVGQVARVHSREVKADQVMAQDPPAGAVLSASGHVDVLLSLGPPARSFVMPDLRGRPLARVEGTLAAAGISVGDVRKRLVPGQPDGIVQSQFPPPGTKVQSDGSVSVTVSDANGERMGGPGGVDGRQ